MTLVPCASHGTLRTTNITDFIFYVSIEGISDYLEQSRLSIKGHNNTMIHGKPFYFVKDIINYYSK